MGLYHRVVKKDYLHGKAIYCYERFYVPIPKEYHILRRLSSEDSAGDIPGSTDPKARAETESKERESLGGKLKKKGLSNLTNPSPLHVREQVAEKVGVSSGQLYMIEKIYENEDKIPKVVKKT